MTPLIPALFDRHQILFKLDFIFPTGSFKDRGTSFFISYVPAYTSSGKLVQIEMYGAKIKKIPGTREDTSAAVIESTP